MCGISLALFRDKVYTMLYLPRARAIGRWRKTGEEAPWLGDRTYLMQECNVISVMGIVVNVSPPTISS
jgi:hypothetical protein